MNTPNLDGLRIASPCKVSWESMTGDDRVRACASCKMNVYNLSDMTKTEAENLLTVSEGRVCVAFFRREDGTILTKDCPVGLRAIRVRVAVAAASLGAWLLAALWSVGLRKDPPGKIPEPVITRTAGMPLLMGEAVAPEFTKGRR